MDVNARCAVLEREIKRDKETAEVDAGDELCGEGEGEARCVWTSLLAIIE